MLIIYRSEVNALNDKSMQNKELGRE